MYCVWVILHGVWRAGHATSRVVRSLGVVGIGVGIHVAILVVHGLVLGVVSIRMLLMRILRPPPASIACVRPRSGTHIYRPSTSTHSTDTSWHGLPSRQMMIHLAGLGFMKQRRSRPLLPVCTG